MNDKSFSLYAIDKFFVEVELDQLTDKIIGKKVFMHGHCMEKYSGDLGFKRPTTTTSVALSNVAVFYLDIVSKLINCLFNNSLSC